MNDYVNELDNMIDNIIDIVNELKKDGENPNITKIIKKAKEKYR